MSGKIIVCRCEDVTRSEIDEALAAGHRDIESLKRFTGLGTGLCQGKQCIALGARLLAAAGAHRSISPITPRPPLHPIPLALLARLVDDEGRA